MIGFLDLLDTNEEKNKFSDLYDLYKDLLYWIALKKVHNTADAEECVQETFLYIAKHFDKIEQVDSKRTKCYLSTIVTGFAIDIYNKSKKADFVLENDEQAFYQTPDELTYYEKYDEVEIASIISTALDEEERTLLYLKYIYGYKSKEIAQIYNVTDSYIRKKLQHAKEKLRKSLGNE